MANVAITVLVTNGAPYVVPANKLFIGSANPVTNVSASLVFLDGIELGGSGKVQPIAANAGQTFTTGSNSWTYTLNGILFDA